MSTDLDLRFEKLNRNTVGVRLHIDERLVQAYQVNPYREPTIAKVIAHITDQFGLQVDAEALTRDIRQRSMNVLQGTAEDVPAPERNDPLGDMPHEIREAALDLLKDPELLMLTIQATQDLGVAGEEEMISAIYLTGTSRLLPQPLATMTTGTSSSGKSFVLEQVAQLFPSESKFIISSSSSKSFYYLPEGSLQHKWVVMGEQARTATDESEDVKRTLREMLSAGRISRAVSLASDGQIVTRIFTQEGPIAYSDSTTQTQQFAEDVNRTIVLHPDESPEQTRAVLRRLAEERLGGRLSLEQRQQLIETHHALQRLLRPHRIVVPYGHLLAESLSTSNVEMRRGLPLFLSAIEACTLLHQLQRPLDDAGRLVASYRDFAVVAELLSGWLVENLAGGVSKATNDFYQWLRSEFSETDQITIAICQQKGKSQGQANHHLDKLVRAGLVNQVNERVGGRSRAKVYRLVAGERAQRSVGLPSVEAVRDFCGERS